jgi:hypothetical protein
MVIGSTIRELILTRGAFVSLPSGPAMCEKCVKLDNRIAHYRDLAMQMDDPQALAAIASLIGECEAQKLALHPERRESGAADQN